MRKIYVDTSLSLQKHEVSDALLSCNWWNCISAYHYRYIIFFLRASLRTQMVKNLPAMQEIGFWSLGQEDPLEKVMGTHSSILAWRIIF